MEWIFFKENDNKTYPKEGYNVIVSDGTNYDVAWYYMSGEYKWLKNDLIKDESNEFNQFKITKWKHIQN